MSTLKIHANRLEVESHELALIDGIVLQALARFSHLLRELELGLLDVNGPKGGKDKRCCIRARLHPRGLIVVRGSGRQYAEAANSAADKLQQALVRRQARNRSLKRGRVPEQSWSVDSQSEQSGT